MTPEAQKFIDEKISILHDEGYKGDQAVAIAYSYARKAGYKMDKGSRKMATGGKINPSTGPFGGFKQVGDKFRSKGYEVLDMQMDEPSVGISEGWVIWVDQDGNEKEISYNDAEYLTMEQIERESVDYNEEMETGGKVAPSWFSLVLVSKDHGDGKIDGSWVQDHIGTLDSATQAAKDTEAANGNKQDYAVVSQLSGSTPNYEIKNGLDRLDIKRIGAMMKKGGKVDPKAARRVWDVEYQETEGGPYKSALDELVTKEEAEILAEALSIVYFSAKAEIPLFDSRVQKASISFKKPNIKMSDDHYQDMAHGINLVYWNTPNMHHVEEKYRDNPTAAMWVLFHEFSFQKQTDDSHPAFQKNQYRRAIPYSKERYDPYEGDKLNDDHIESALLSIGKQLFGKGKEKKSSKEPMSFEEFKKELPDVGSPYFGDRDVIFKAKRDKYSDRMAYFKNGRTNSEKISVKTAYTDAYLEDFKDDYKPKEKKSNKVTSIPKPLVYFLPDMQAKALIGNKEMGG